MREESRQHGGIVVLTAMYHNDPSKEPSVPTGVVVRGMLAFSRGSVWYCVEAQW